MLRIRRIVVLCAAAALFGVAMAAVAHADSNHGRHGGHRKHVKHHDYYNDGRHHHDRSYYRHGYSVHSLPWGYHRPYGHGHGHHYYYGGVWYRPWHDAYVVGPAPIGAVIGWLPNHHTTIWVGGFPYYYANQTYYSWDASREGYAVVEEPRDVEDAVVTPSDEVFIYPARGQSEQKQADDRYECHSWAVKQTRYDPSLPLPADQRAGVDQLRADYHRAMSACLEGRGYTVK